MYSSEQKVAVIIYLFNKYYCASQLVHLTLTSPNQIAKRAPSIWPGDIPRVKSMYVYWIENL